MYSLEQTLKELEEVIDRLRVHLRNTVLLVFATKLELAIHQHMEEEASLSHWTENGLKMTGEKVWERLDRDKVLTRWNSSLPKDIPEFASWWCMKVVTWKWTKTSDFRDRVIKLVTERLLCEGCSNLIGRFETQV